MASLRRNRTQPVTQAPEDKRLKYTNRDNVHLGGKSTSMVVLLTMSLAIVTSFSVYSYSTLPIPNYFNNNGDHFSTANAREHLEAITKLGIRNAGSETNDVRTRDVILKTVSHLKSLASEKVDIEVSVQNPTGSFFLSFLGGMTHIYDNLTNVVVRLSQHKQPIRHSLLLNCHFDSAIGSPAASDDAVSCAILLEILRCLSTTPVLLDHAVVFLFNGAEEMVLPASHGFITQHPWASEIKAFINLEAAGAGGKELVFQTGPKHPWLAKAYAQSAVYPYGSVFGEEVFQSGVIPGDTDFRIFRDFGSIPGIDMAYFTNGYIYHTEYDVPDAIPDGSIQRAGENILSMIKGIANSPYLADPGEERHGKVIYFDFIGIVMIVYTHRVGIILNSVTVVILLLLIWISGKRRSHKEGYLFILKTTGILLISESAAILSVAMTALLTTVSGNSLSYYARPFLVIPLFYVPAGLAMGGVNYWWGRKNYLLSADYLDYVTSLSSHILWLPLLLITMYFGLSSSFIPFIWTIFPLLFWTILWHKIIRPNVYSETMAFICFSLSLIPVSPAIALAQCLHDLFVPITGRIGSEVLPDFVVAIMSGLLMCMLGLNTIPVLVHYSKKWLLKLITIVGLLIWFLTVSFVVLGLVFPYSARNPIAPKRLFVQHTNLNYHDSDTSSFSGLLIHPLDNELLEPIMDASPYFRAAKEWPCNEIYCGIPQYYPIADMLKRVWYIAADPPPVERAHIELESVSKTSESSRNYTFKTTIPNRGKLYIEPLTGMRLKSWSLTDTIPPLTPYGEGRGCYYVTYTRGFGDTDNVFRYWIEIEGDISISPSVEIAAVSLYLDPPQLNTPQLEEMEKHLPDWVTCVTLTSTLDSWKF